MRPIEFFLLAVLVLYTFVLAIHFTSSKQKPARGRLSRMMVLAYIGLLAYSGCVLLPASFANLP
ncbi:hypothetical protein RCH23_002790 [Cryobacterium sp. CAN_C3]|nr:hypothetical protein [Cryobacterium sp. CAN_C3]